MNAAEALPAADSKRLDSIDVLRGIVMVVMALDHVRDFFHASQGVDPTDLARTTPALFLTRFVTHYCAPVFVFLAGTGACLSFRRGKTRGELARFLVTRGAWLVFLELVVMHFAWTFNLDFHWLLAGVIWAIGWSMIALAGLVFLPARAVLVFGIAMVLAHNALDGVTSLGSPFLDGVWSILHVRGEVEYADGRFLGVLYPLVPWIGVMAAGYGFGELVQGAPEQRRHRILAVGLAACAAFVVLRAFDVYGEPQPWSRKGDVLFSVFSFVNCTKYPPSLDYLLMTLGPALVLLALLPERATGVLRPFVVFGRVPLFYYLLHVLVIHGLALLCFAGKRDGAGFGLPAVYAVWIAVVLLLYLPCRWFAELKRRRRDAWLSYL